jgi:hypothetical protein
MEAMISARRHRAADQEGSPLSPCPTVSDRLYPRGMTVVLITMTVSFGPMPPRSGTDCRQLNDPHQNEPGGDNEVAP